MSKTAKNMKTKKAGSLSQNKIPAKPNSIKRNTKKSSQKKSAPKKSDLAASGLKAGFTRPEKTDFTLLYQAHKSEMNNNGGDIDSMIALRRKIHSFGEGGFQEFET